MIKKIYFLLIALFATIKTYSQFIDVPDKVCLATTKELQLKAGGGKTYKWVGPNGFTSNEQNPIIKNISEANSGNYQVVVDGVYPFTKTIYIGKSNPPVLSYYISFRNTLIYSANGLAYGNDFKISGPNGFESNSNYGEITTLTPKNQGVYILETSDSFGCQQSANFVYKMQDTVCYENLRLKILADGNLANSYPMKVVPFQINSYTSMSVCDKSQIFLELDSAIVSSGKVKWFKDNKLLPENSHRITHSGAGYYHATFENKNCRYSTEYSVSIAKATIASPLLKFSNINNKQDTLEFCSFSSYNQVYIDYDYWGGSPSVGKENYEIYKDGIKYLNNGSSRYLNITEAGTYRVRANYDACSSMGDPIVVKQNKSAKPQIAAYGVAFSENINVCKSIINSGFYLEVSFPGYISLHKDGSFVSNANYNIGKYITESGNYTLSFSANSDCQQANTFRVNYGNKMDADVSKYSRNIDCNVSEFLYPRFYLDNSKSDAVKWFNKTNGVETQVGRTFNFYPNDTGRYYFKYNQDDCSVVSNEKSVKFTGAHSIDFDEEPVVNLCKGEIYFLKLKNCSSGYVEWYKDGVFIEANFKCGLMVGEAGKYTFKNSDCSSSSRIIEVKLIDIPKPEINVSCNAGTNIIKLTEDVETGILDWYLNNQPKVEFKNLRSINSDLIAKYSVILSLNGCSKASDEIMIGVKDDFSQAICRGSKIGLSPSTKFSTYKWTGPQNYTSNSDSLVITNFGPKNVGEYSVTVSFGNSCQMSTKFKLFNSDLPDFDLPLDITTCKGNNLLSFIKPKGLTETSEAGYSSYQIRFSENPYVTYVPSNSTYDLNQRGKYTILQNSSSFATFTYNGQGYSSSCTVTKTVNVQLTNELCKKIVVPDISKMKICYGEDIKIPFDIIGQATKSDKDFKLWYQVFPYFQYFQSQEVLDTTIASKVLPKNGTFVLPSSSFSKKDRQYLVFMILANDGLIVPYNKFVTVELGNRYLGSTVMNKLCDGFQIVHYENFPKSTILDSMFVFRENQMVGKTSDRVFLTQTEGIYQVRAKYKNKNDEYYDGSLECLVETSSGDLKTSSYNLVYISGNSNIYCKDGYQVLKLSYSSENKIEQVRWYRDNILIEKFNNLVEIKITEDGVYHAQVKFLNCSETSPPFEFKKELYGIRALNYKINNQYLNTNKFDKETFSICPFATNTLKISLNSWEGYFYNQNNLSVNYQVYKGNTIFSEGTIGGEEVKVPISDAGEYFVRASTPFCTNLSKAFTVKKETENLALGKEIVSMCDGRLFNYILQYENKGLSDFGSIIDLELFKNGQTIKKDKLDSRSEIKYATYLSESGKYFYKVKHNYEKGSCIFNSETLDLNINDTLFLGSENRTLSSCDSPVYLSFETNGVQYSNELQRTLADMWYRNGKAIPNTRNQSNYTTNEPGVYKVLVKTKEGCTLISPEYTVKTGRVDAQIARGGREFDNLECTNSKGNVLYINLFGTLQDYKKLSYEYYQDDKFVKKVSPSVENSNFEITAPGVYYAKIKYPGCDSETERIEIKSLPTIPTLTPSGQLEICNGKTITLKVQNASASNIIWEKNGQLSFGQSDSLKIDQAGKYAVYVKDSSCYFESGLLNIKALEISKTLNLNGTVEFCPKDTLMLRAQKSDETILYSLLRNNQKTISNYSGIFPINLKGEYSISQSRNNCQLTTESVTLVPKTDNELTLSDASFCKGSNVSLSAVSNQDYLYAWFKNGKLIEDTKSNILKINTEGSYKALLSSKDCETFSSEFFVSEKPELTATIKGDTTINFGDKAVLFVNFTSSPPYSFAVNSESIITTSLNPFRYTVAPQLTTNYRINKVSNICGEGKGVGSAEVKVLVLSLGTENKIGIFPNPSSDYINFEGDLAGIKEIVVIGSNGKRMMLRVKDFKNEISIVNWSSGIYVIKLFFKDRVEEFKLLKL